MANINLEELKAQYSRNTTENEEVILKCLRELPKYRMADLFSNSHNGEKLAKDYFNRNFFSCITWSDGAYINCDEMTFGQVLDRIMLVSSVIANEYLKNLKVKLITDEDYEDGNEYDECFDDFIEDYNEAFDVSESSCENECEPEDSGICLTNLFDELDRLDKLEENIASQDTSTSDDINNDLDELEKTLFGDDRNTDDNTLYSNPFFVKPEIIEPFMRIIINDDVYLRLLNLMYQLVVII